MKEIIKEIKVIENVKLANTGNHTDKAQLGIASMLNVLYGGYEEYDSGLF